MNSKTDKRFSKQNTQTFRPSSQRSGFFGQKSAVKQTVKSKASIASLADKERHKFKTTLCTNFPKGMCKYGENCFFAHGKAELHYWDNELKRSVPISQAPKQVQGTTTPQPKSSGVSCMKE